MSHCDKTQKYKDSIDTRRDRTEPTIAVSEEMPQHPARNITPADTVLWMDKWQGREQSILNPKKGALHIEF